MVLTARHGWFVTELPRFHVGSSSRSQGLVLRPIRSSPHTVDLSQIVESHSFQAYLHAGNTQIYDFY
jgi:hypothetical protein